jgi:hypothetical protein
VQLVKLFGDVRDHWIETDLQGWLAPNRIYPGVVDPIRHALERDEVYIVTTKQVRLLGRVPFFASASYIPVTTEVSDTRCYAELAGASTAAGAQQQSITVEHTCGQEASSAEQLHVASNAAHGTGLAYSAQCSTVQLNVQLKAHGYYLACAHLCLQAEYTEILMRDMAGLPFPSDRIFSQTISGRPKGEVLAALAAKHPQAAAKLFVEDKLGTLEKVCESPHAFKDIAMQGMYQCCTTNCQDNCLLCWFVGLSCCWALDPEQPTCF